MSTAMVPMVQPAASPQTHPQLAVLLPHLLHHLQAIPTTWAVLRNADTLPDSTRYDVDLLLHSRDVPAIRRAVLQACQQQHWTLLTQVDKHGYAAQWLMSPGDVPVFLPIDCLTDLSWHGHRYAHVSHGLSTRIKTPAGIWTVRPGFEAAVTLCKDLLPWGNLKDKSRQRVQQCAQADADGFVQTLAPYVGAEMASRLHEAVAAGRWDEIPSLAKQLRRRVRRFSPAAIWRWLRFAIGSLRHHFDSRLNAFVVLLGPDGSGKTTIADELAARMLDRPFKGVQRCKASFGIIPQMKTYKNWLLRALGRKVAPPKETEPGAQHVGMVRPLPGWRALIYQLYYATDLAVGRLKLLRWRAQWSLVLFDRYFYDYYYMLGHVNAPRWMSRLIELLVPRPDLIIYLDRDAEEIYSRKPELSIDEIRRQQQIIKQTMGGRRSFRCVDGRGGVDATVRAVQRVVIEHLIAKGRRTTDA